MRRPRTRRALSAGLVACMAWLVAACGLTGGDRYEVVAYFPRAVALYESGAVQVLGLPAGEVTDITVEGDQVRVTMAIDADIVLPTDVRAALVPQSLIGERRVQLFPPFREGDVPVAEGYVIPAEHTVIPVEPDEALAALEEFLDSLDPNGVGRLVNNLADAVDGQGANLGAALGELAGLVDNIEASDENIVHIADRFDDFTATLLQREGQLAQVLDDFSVVAGVLADERAALEELITSLASLSENGLDLVSEHAVRLRTDVEIVTRLVAAAATNVDAVGDIIEAGPPLYDGFIGAYNPELRAFDLRNSFTPLAEEALSPVFESVGLTVPCVPLLVSCAGAAVALGSDPGVRAEFASPSPIDAVLEFLHAPAAPASATAADAPPSLWRRLLGTALGVSS